MSWHWVGPGRGPRELPVSPNIRFTMDCRLARRAALSAADGVPVPPRAFMTLSSIGHSLGVGGGVGRRLTMARRRHEAIEDARRADDRRLLRMRDRDLDHLD